MIQPGKWQPSSELASLFDQNLLYLLVTGIQLLPAYPENHMEIWLVILFLSRKKFHAKQTFVLGFMKLGPDGSLSV